MPLIEETLTAAGVGYDALTAVACTTGPGSFTGIRIGLAAARGIAFAANIPPLGYTTLQVMAFSTEAHNALAIINAGKGEVFYQYFSDANSEPAVGKLEDILAQFPNATIASTVALPAGYVQPTITHPRADSLAQLAATSPQKALPLSPFYIRPPDAKPSLVIPSLTRDDK